MERPILFNDAMVCAILSGAKTQTRRPVLVGGAPVHHDRTEGGWRKLRDGWAWVVENDVRGGVYPCPFGVPGDLLWVRECFALSVRDPEDTDRDAKDPSFWDPPVYRATYEPGGGWTQDGERIAPPWRPSIHMPRWASRLTLRVIDVRVERVQDISEADAVAEGTGIARIQDARDPSRGPLVDAFANAWSSAYGPESWTANLWVWVVNFERAEAGR